MQPQKGSLKAIAQAIGMPSAEEHRDLVHSFAATMAEMIDAKEHRGYDPATVGDAACYFLAFRLTWIEADDMRAAALSEVLNAVRDALRVHGYDLGLDGRPDSMHTPNPRSGLDHVSDEMTLQLLDRGFDDDESLGFLDALLWHAMAHHAVAGHLLLDTASQAADLHAGMWPKLLKRIASSSYDLDAEEGFDELGRIVRVFVDDFFHLTGPDEVVLISEGLRAVFRVEDEALLLWNDAVSKGAPEHAPLLHAAATLAAIAGSDVIQARDVLSAMIAGSSSGGAEMLDLGSVEALYEAVDDLPLLPATKEEPVEKGVAAMLAALTLVGRVEPSDRLRTRMILDAVVAVLHEDLDAIDDDGVEFVERLEQHVREQAVAIERHVEDMVEKHAGTAIDIVRRDARQADPSPPPAPGANVAPIAVTAKLEPGTDRHAVDELIGHLFEASERTMTQHDDTEFSWRLITEVEISYSDAVDAVHRLAAMPGAVEMGVMHVETKGIAVTTATPDGRLVHRLVVSDHED